MGKPRTFIKDTIKWFIREEAHVSNIHLYVYEYLYGKAIGFF